MDMSQIRANVPQVKTGIVGKDLQDVYRELLKGIENPERDLRLQEGESTATGVARLLKLWLLDRPGTLIATAKKGLVNPEKLTEQDLLDLSTRLLVGGAPGGGTGPANLFRLMGQKGQLAKKVAKTIPKGKTYYEPFLGTGKVARSVGKTKKFEKMVLGDVNPRTVNIHKQVMDNPDAVVKHLEKLTKGYSYPTTEEFWKHTIDVAKKNKQGYYSDNPAKQAAADIFVGSYTLATEPGFAPRYGSPQGKYITPKGLVDRIYEHSEVLKTHKADIAVRPWEETIKGAEKGDFIYADPPYLNTAGYRAGTFGMKETEDLSNALEEAYRRGIDSMIHNWVGTEETFSWAQFEGKTGFHGGKELEWRAFHK